MHTVALSVKLLYCHILFVHPHFASRGFIVCQFTVFCRLLLRPTLLSFFLRHVVALFVNWRFFFLPLAVALFLDLHFCRIVLFVNLPVLFAACSLIVFRSTFYHTRLLCKFTILPLSCCCILCSFIFCRTRGFTQ